jgi:hypothetical protein
MHRARHRRRGWRHRNGRSFQSPHANPWGELIGYLHQLEQYVSLYLRVREDTIKVTAREILWRVLLVIMARIAAIVVIAVSIVYVFAGTSDGLALLFGGRRWLASLATGGGSLVILGLILWVGHYLVSRAAHRRRIAEYEKHEDRYERAAPGAGIPGGPDEPGTLGHGPRTDGHRPQRPQSR